jgi:NAD(P)-dependent dehydrogenase (short-subunit alcohol dehydrogenase family)
MAIKTRQLTEDGFEMQVGTNHLGHFYLTQLLSDILKKTPQSRVINVSSSAHRFPRKEINLSTLMNQETYSPWPQYGKTKLLNIYFSQLIFSKYGVKSVSLHPGAVRTELLRNTVNNIFMKIFFVIIYPFWWFFSKNCVQGAQTTLQCALIPYESLENGKFYADCKVASTTSLAVQPGEAEKAWNWSVNMI